MYISLRENIHAVVMAFIVDYTLLFFIVFLLFLFPTFTPFLSLCFLFAGGGGVNSGERRSLTVLVKWWQASSGVRIDMVKATVRRNPKVSDFLKKNKFLCHWASFCIWACNISLGSRAL